MQLWRDCGGLFCEIVWSGHGVVVAWIWRHWCIKSSDTLKVVRYIVLQWQTKEKGITFNIHVLFKNNGLKIKKKEKRKKSKLYWCSYRDQKVRYVCLKVTLLVRVSLSLDLQKSEKNPSTSGISANVWSVQKEIKNKKQQTKFAQRKSAKSFQGLGLLLSSRGVYFAHMFILWAYLYNHCEPTICIC